MQLPPVDRNEQPSVGTDNPLQGSLRFKAKIKEEPSDDRKHRGEGNRHVDTYGDSSNTSVALVPFKRNTDDDSSDSDAARHLPL